MEKIMARYNPHMSANADNPLPFKQPFLTITLKGDNSKALNCSDHGVAHIDVDGQIEKYISEDNKPTGLLIELCKAFAKAGAVAVSFGRYRGSAGPNMLLRNGVLFIRHTAIEEPPADVLAYEYRTPVSAPLND
ncbi:hypothetical protein K2P47_01340 [Patescibacteria group bacterium]|nr:hypothetical protein [Patescibacteria group bacterium]